MRQYAVSVTVAGKNVEEIILARSAADAIAVVKARYPQALVWGARPVS